MTELPRWSYEVTSARMVAYAGATWDWHRLHHDAAFARGLGFPGPVVDGQHLGALVSSYVARHAGPSWRLRSLSFSLVRPAVAGDLLLFDGEVEEQPSELSYDITVAKRDVRGDLPVMSHVLATCVPAVRAEDDGRPDLAHDHF